MAKYKQILQTLDSCYINFEEYVHLSELRITSLDQERNAFILRACTSENLNTTEEDKLREIRNCGRLQLKNKFSNIFCNFFVFSQF